MELLGLLNDHEIELGLQTQFYVYQLSGVPAHLSLLIRQYALEAFFEVFCSLRMTENMLFLFIDIASLTLTVITIELQ